MDVGAAQLLLYNVKFMRAMTKLLSVFISAECNFGCTHCMCEHCGIPPLNEDEYGNVVDVCTSIEAESIQLTGGEPTLHPKIISGLLETVLIKFPKIAVELITNAHFGYSYDACHDVLGSIKNLRRVIVSYDRFHASYVGMARIKGVVEYCKRNDIEISGYAVVSTPDDLCRMLENEKLFGVQFNYQKTMPVGRALANSEFFQCNKLDTQALSHKCPQSMSFVYFPTYGVTTCCSSLFFKAGELLRRSISNTNAMAYRNSKFYRYISNYTMGEIADMSSNDGKCLEDYISVCELCSHVVPRALGVNDV